MNRQELLAHFHGRQCVRYFPVVTDDCLMKNWELEALLENEFRFNEESHVLPSAVDWSQNPSADREWLILLHKFYYAVALGVGYSETGDERYSNKWIELTDSWIQTVGTELLSSDVAGRRIQNWIVAHYYFVSTARECRIDPEFHERFLISLHEQVSWLRAHLSPVRNHRTLELTAIFVAGVIFPELQDAAGWLEFSKAELLANMRSDLLPDGVHCELSTDYHHIVLRNFLVVRRLAGMNGIDVPEEMDEYLRRALEFSKWVHRPDGVIPSFSDGDTGCFLDLLAQGYELYRDPELLYVASRGRCGEAPTKRGKGFTSGGYYILRSGWGDRDESFETERHLVFDCGPLGAGNHGHLDVLHFEAYAYGRALIVDPGRYSYYEGGPTNWRAVFRRTSYHNTVTVDGQDQTCYRFNKTRFKICGPPPDRECSGIVHGDEVDYLQGTCRSHEYGAVHERRIVFVRGEYWIVSDWLKADEQHEYDVWFHLSPDAQDQIVASKFCVQAPHLTLTAASRNAFTLAVEQGFVSPKYGVKQPAPVVRLHCRAQNATVHTVLFPFAERRPEVTISLLGQSALQVSIRDEVGTTTDKIKWSEREHVTFRRRTEQKQVELTGQELIARS